MSTAEERMQNYIEELKQENRLLRARNTRLEAEANAAPVQEPVALKPCWYESKEKTMCRKCGQVHAEAIPPAAQRQWVGLTDEDKLTVRRIPWETLGDLMDNIEAKLKEKNS